MGRITDLKILQEYGDYGLYWCKFKGEPKLFTINHGVIKVLTHYSDHDELNLINSDVAKELEEKIGDIKEEEKIKDSLNSAF